MKRTNFCLLILFISMLASAQVTSRSVNEDPYVKVKNWGEKLFLFPPNYWENKYEEIVAQIGADEFEKVKKFSYYQNIPSQMTIFDGRKIVDTVTLYKKFDQLKVQHIATFTHFTRAGINRGKFAILRVPYKGNANWDTAAKWDTVYFVIGLSQIYHLN